MTKYTDFSSVIDSYLDTGEVLGCIYNMDVLEYAAKIIDKYNIEYFINNLSPENVDILLEELNKCKG